MVKYVEVADALARRIADGTYPVGARLPAVRTLMEEFGVSDSVVQRALGRLAELGLVEGRERVGTIVVATQPLPEPPRLVDRSLEDRVADLERWVSDHDRRHGG